MKRLIRQYVDNEELVRLHKRSCINKIIRGISLAGKALYKSGR